MLDCLTWLSSSSFLSAKHSIYHCSEPLMKQMLGTFAIFSRHNMMPIIACFLNNPRVSGPTTVNLCNETEIFKSPTELYLKNVGAFAPCRKTKTKRKSPEWFHRRINHNEHSTFYPCVARHATTRVQPNQCFLVSH